MSQNPTKITLLVALILAPTVFFIIATQLWLALAWPFFALALLWFKLRNWATINKDNLTLLTLQLNKAEERLQEIRHSVNKDALTGLHSRVYITERLDEIAQIVMKKQRKAAVLYLDLDFFKEVNDALGHNLGDQLLVSVAKRMRSIVKREDLLAYLGGDEFLVVLPEIKDGLGGELVARRILEELTKPFPLQGHQLAVSSSIGIAICPIDGANGNDLIYRAERALIQAKSNGRKGYSFYSPALNAVARERLKVDQQLRGALARQELSLVYQPIIDVETSAVKGFEALLRWTNPELGRVSPVAFIPVAEQIGLISELGAWVMRESMQQLRAWQMNYRLPLIMSVNVSPKQFQDESILPLVKSVLRETGLKPEFLQIEVTEGLLLTATDSVKASINLLKQAGVKLALDDFGTGYSSLSYLTSLPFDVIKVDKGFVDDICQQPSSKAMVSAVIGIAHALNMKTVVEGVEQADQVYALKEMGADAIQGYYYAQPLPAKEAEARFLASSSFSNVNEYIWEKL